MRLALSRRTALLASAALVVPAVALGASATAAGPKAAAPPAAALPGAKQPVLPSKLTVGGLSVENSFVSSVGWVKPNETYPSRILLKNDGKAPVSDVRVTIPPPAAWSFTGRRAAVGKPSMSGRHRSPGTVPSVLPAPPSRCPRGAGEEHRGGADRRLAQHLQHRERVRRRRRRAEGRQPRPQGHPADRRLRDARYGDRPFPVVPVDYADFKHKTPAAELETVINDPKNPASTFNLFQEMSFGQLFPKGVIGSIGVESRPVAPEDELRFSRFEPTQANTCTGVTAVTRAAARRPRRTPSASATAGTSCPASAPTTARTPTARPSSARPRRRRAAGDRQRLRPHGQGGLRRGRRRGPRHRLQRLRHRQGRPGRLLRGRLPGLRRQRRLPAVGRADCNEPPNDNIWPHSSSLEFSYTDPTTGLTGYMSKDRLKDLEGNLLFYTDDTYTKTTTRKTEFPAFVRVGPYNVNPETSIEFASVISHEYGHSLGLPTTTPPARATPTATST
jgi:hypothetical protein